MYKVYKSMEIKMGDKKELQYISDNIVKKNQEEPKDIPEEKEKPDEIAEKKAERILAKAEKESMDILENAKQEAAMIIEEAYDDSKAILEKAKTDGYNDGFQLGKQEGYAAYQDLLNEAMMIKKETYQAKKELAKELEEEIIHLVLHSINKVIDYELQENHELLFNLINKGLEKCTFTETLIIRVSDEDFDMLDSHKNKIYMMTEGIEDLQVKKDPALKKGSVIIETPSGKIDASLELQINQIETLYKQLLRSEGFHEGNSAR